MDRSIILVKGPGRISQPVQALLLSKLTLAPAICLYSATTFFIASMSRQWDTKTVISVNVDSKKDTTQGRTCPLPFLSLQSRGSKVRTQRRGDGGQHYQTDCSIANALECLSFTCTTARGLWYIMLIHLRNSGLNSAVSKTDVKNQWSRLWKDLN